VLEFSKPKKQWFKGLYNLYMKIIAPKAGQWLSKNKDAYQYLNNSVKAFPKAKHFYTFYNKRFFSNNLKKAELRYMYNLLWNKRKG
jgi:demethylmenaquinone methyltransferase/2-methoxy-6-polyprenyl-1,4-benzoquinol methylase